MNAADYLLERAEPGRIALIDTSAQHTYGDLRRACESMLAALHERGIGPGDRVGLLAGNSLFWAASYLSILRLGAVCVPLSTFLSPSGLQEAMAQAGCRALCLQRRHLRRLGASSAAGSLPLVSDETIDAGWAAREAWPATDPTFDTASLAALVLTSGTTAKPRLVMVSHGNILANTESIIESLGLTGDSRIMAVLPFFYCFGTSLLHTHLRVGGSVVLGESFAYPETILDLLQATECTGFAGVPSTFQTLLRNSSFRERAFPTLRSVQQAGGRLPEVQIRELVDALPGADVFIMYGQTEATARLSCLAPGMLPTKLGSIGRGIPGVDLQVVGEDGNSVRPGQVGEIVARGANITLGYLDEPDASAEKFVDGALRTGDLATVDEDGFIYIVDRKADFIKCYGHRISSQQVEAGVLKHPEVVVAAVVGVPDEAQGEAIVAFVMLRDGACVTPDGILEHCRRQLPRHMVPSAVLVLPRMPMNANGKIVKAELRSLAASRYGKGVGGLSSETKPIV